MSLKRTLTKALIGVALVSSLYGLPTKKANAWEFVSSSGYVFVLPDDAIKIKTQNNKQSKTNLYKQKQEKHYNWIRPDKYSKWQCAYELIYDGNKPNGFKIYVDVDGDNKPEYKYVYYLGNYGGFFNGASFTFYRNKSGYPVEHGYYHNLKKATNVCLQPAIIEVIGKGNYLGEPVSNFKIDEIEADVDYIRVELLTRY